MNQKYSDSLLAAGLIFRPVTDGTRPGERMSPSHRRQWREFRRRRHELRR